MVTGGEENELGRGRGDGSYKQVFFWEAVKKGYSSVRATVRPQLSAQGFHRMRSSELRAEFQDWIKQV